MADSPSWNIESLRIETESKEFYDALLALDLKGVSVQRIRRYSEATPLEIVIYLANGMGRTLFAPRLEGLLLKMHPHKTTINGKEVPSDSVYISVFINSIIEVSEKESNS